MGANVRAADVVSPPKFRLDVCPHCQNKKRVVNGAWLRWKREVAEVDQRTFAYLIGISGPYISDIERNRRSCPDFVLKAYKKL